MHENNESKMEVLNSNTFQMFTAEYDKNKYPVEEIKFIFLKGYCNYPIHLIARILSIRYADALALAKKLIDEINNARADRKLSILHKEKVSFDHLLKTKAKQLRAISDELERRLEDTDRFKDVSDKHLLDLLQKLEAGVQLDDDYFTGDMDNGRDIKERLSFQK